MRALGAAVVFAGMTFAAAAAAQPAAPPAQPAGTPLKDLLSDGFGVASSSNNGNASEVVLVLKKDKKHFACVLSGLRADTYGQPARPVFPACIALN